MPSPPHLDVDRLHPPHLLDPSELNSLSGSARACLSRHHDPPARFVIDSDGAPHEVDLAWNPPTEAQEQTAANLRESTARGACGCALAAVAHAKGLIAFGAAADGTGADYRLVPADEAERDAENWILMEVSGINQGGRGAITSRRNARMRRLRRARKGDAQIALTAIVGFDSRIIELRTVA